MVVNLSFVLCDPLSDSSEASLFIALIGSLALCIIKRAYMANKFESSSQKDPLTAFFLYWLKLVSLGFLSLTPFRSFKLFYPFSELTSVCHWKADGNSLWVLRFFGTNAVISQRYKRAISLLVDYCYVGREITLLCFII